MGTTPLLNRLKANNEIIIDVPFIAGSYIPSIGRYTPTPTGAAVLTKKGLAGLYAAYPLALNALSGNISTVSVFTALSTSPSSAYFILNGNFKVGITAGPKYFVSRNGGATAAGTAAGTVIPEKRICLITTSTDANPSLCNLYLDGIQSGAANQSGGVIADGTTSTYLGGGNANFVVEREIIINRILTAQEAAQLTAEVNSISYPTAVYEIRPPDYPTIKDGTPSFALCCGETTDKANGVTPTTATAVERKKDAQMADYLQFTRASSSKLDYGIQTQNQLNYEFEWDGDVYFDTDAVGQITEVIKVGDSATGVCFGLRKLATEKFQFIYGAEATVDFTYSVPSLGPLHIVLRREWVTGSTYDIKLWVNGSYIEKVTGSYAGTGNASAKTYIGYSGNITNTNFLSGRIYYSVIYPHLRPVEKFQKNPFSKNMVLGWGVRANNTVNTVERDTDNVVTVVSGGATFKVNSGFGDTGKLQKWLETGASAATFRIRNISSNDGLTVYYRALTTKAWTEGNGLAGDLTVDGTGLFTLAANRAMLWSEL